MAASETSRTILLVEDERLVAIAQRRALERYGYAVVTAASGEEAVEAVRNAPDIDLVLMDIDLGPGMDGIAAAERLLALREMPLVFLSSHTESDVVERTERITSYGYIVKHSGDAVLDISIKMAFRLFAAKRRESETELALETGRVRTQALMNAIPDLMLLFDRNGYIVDYRPARGHGLLVPPERFLRQHVSDALPPYLAELTMERLDRVFDVGAQQVYTYTIGAGAHERFFESRLVPCGAELALSIVRETTEQEHTRSSMVRQSSILRALVDIASAYIDAPSSEADLIVADSLGRIGMCVKADRAYLFVYDDRRMAASNTHEWCASDVEPQREELQDVQMALLAPVHDSHSRGEPYVVSNTLELPEGELRAFFSGQGILSLVTVPLVTGGHCSGFVGFDFVRDRHLPSEEEIGLLTVFARILVNATQRRDAEKRVESLLHEKDLLLREAHHRVKNNLGIVRSLLGLEADRRDDSDGESARSILREAAERVGGMAALYDRLYASPDLTDLDIRDFLPPVVEEIVRLYDPAGAVRITTDVDSCPLSARQLSPLGIIINELITNSMKHAFPQRDGGLISITAARHGDTVAVTYEDEAQGVPAAPRTEAGGTFGLQLIHALAEQLGGTITSELSPGSRYRLVFPLQPNAARRDRTGTTASRERSL